MRGVGAAVRVPPALPRPVRRDRLHERGVPLSGALLLVSDGLGTV